MIDPTNAPYMLTPGEVAEVLRVDERTVRKWAEEGRFPGVWRSPKCVRIPRDSVFTLNAAHVA